MKKHIAIIVSVLLLTSCLYGCGQPRVINGKEYETIGLVDMLNGDKDPCIKYRVSVGNVIWGAILFTTIVAPIYFYGFSCMNPIEPKTCDGK